MNRWLVASALFGAIGVVLGAFGAHGLKSRLSDDQLASWNTAVEYHLLHTLALLVVALLADSRPVTISAVSWSIGIVLFSGSIYLLCLGGPRWLGPVTPLGGVALIVGWLGLLATARG